MKTRVEHLQWCRDRANEYLTAGQPVQAVTSMMSDLGKHPETKILSGGAISSLGILAMMDGEAACKRFIDGFN